jgi:micrococcal nuclease
MIRTAKIFSILLAFLFLFPLISFASDHRVIRVVDGDTIVVDYQGTYEKVRLLCVNTPESVHPDKKQNILMGKVASDYTKSRLTGSFVDLEFEGPIRGRYGRLLCYVILDGANFNIELVKQGLSPYYTKYGQSKKYHEEFKEAERYARHHNLNIWGDEALSQKYLRLKSKWGQYQSKEQSLPATVQNTECTYVASKNSKVFHRPDCKWVKKISPKNLIGFKTREEAIRSGRRPCKTCKP